MCFVLWTVGNAVKTGSFYANMLKLFTGTFGSHVIWGLSMMVAARLYTAEEIGEEQLFLSAASMLETWAYGRYDKAVAIPKEQFQAVRLVLFSVLLSLGSGTLLLLLLAAMRDSFSWLAGISGGSLFLLPLFVMEISLYMIFYAWLVRTKNYTVASKGLALFPAAYLFLCVVLYFVPISVQKLILALVLARGAEVLYYMRHLYRDMRAYKGRVSVREVLQSGREYADFPKYVLPGKFLESLAADGVPFLLNAFWGTTATGYYAMAMRAFSSPSGLIQKAVGDVFWQESSILYGRCSDCSLLYRKTLLLCLKISTVVCACAYLVAPTAFSLFFGGDWIVSGIYMRRMLPMMFLMFVAVPLVNMYIVARRQCAFLGIQAMYFLSSVIGLGIVGWSGGDMETALTAWSVLSAMVSGVSIYGGKRIAENQC